MKTILIILVAIVIIVPNLMIIFLGLHSDDVWEEIYRKNLKGENDERDKENKRNG